MRKRARELWIVQAFENFVAGSPEGQYAAALRFNSMILALDGEAVEALGALG